MVNINKAILHTMDSSAKMYFCSEEELLLDLNINIYLNKHMEKVLNDASSQKGVFKSSSNLGDKLQKYSELSFIELTKEIAKQWFEEYCEALRYIDMNLLFIEFEEDSTPYFGVLQFKNKEGFIRDINNEGGITRNEIISFKSILPSVNQIIDEYFIINLVSSSILFKEEKRFMNGKETLLISDDILGCESQLSTKDSLKLLDQMVIKVSNEVEEDVLDNTLKMKQYVKDCVEGDKKIDVKDICRCVFPNKEKFTDKFEELVKENKIPEVIPLQKDAPVAMRKHKIKTDLGIEISIPLDFAESKDTFNITTNSDGSVSIELKHIGKILK